MDRLPSTRKVRAIWIALVILCPISHPHHACARDYKFPLHAIQVGQQARVYTVEKHRVDGSHGLLPVIVFLHGTGTQITDIPARFDIPFGELSELGPALIVRPQGANRTWDVIPAGIDTYRRLSGLDGEKVDDIGFLRALISQMVEHEDGDPLRVYLVGVSMGGYMAVRVACELSDRVAAVAAVISTARASQLSHCANARSIPVLLMASTNDPEVPYAGQRGDEATATLSAPETVSFFANRNACKSRIEQPLPHEDIAIPSTISLIRYLNCTGGADVYFYRVDGSGHSVPSKAPYEENDWKANGARNRDINTAQAVWSFFGERR
jgi:polyhydroxybutyrate depolymerase